MDNNENNEEKFFVKASEVSVFWFDMWEAVVPVIIVTVFLMTFVFRLFTVSGPSMKNTLMNRDKVFVWRYNYVPTDGDVVVIKKYGQLSENIVKRVIATEGETLDIDYAKGEVFVNDKKLDEYYIREPMVTKGNAEIPSVIPEGKIFVMGDNRNESADSRYTYIGLVDVKNVVGKVRAVYFPFYRIRYIPRAVRN